MSGPHAGRKVKVAVVQAASVAFDLPASLAKLSTLTDSAAKSGASLVLFPEAFLSGYPRGCDFGCVIGSRTPEGRELFRRYAESSIEVPSAHTEAIGLVASRNRVYIVVGVIEKVVPCTLYCSVLFFGPDGALLGKHRKLMPTAQERVVWGFGDGSTLPVLDTSIGKLAAAICWENYMPMLRMAYYAKGVEIYLAPTADARDTWVATMRHIAMEGRCFVLSSNQFCKRKDYPNDYPIESDGPEEVLCKGGSLIVNPSGQVIAGPDYDGEGVLIAELDLDDCTRGKLDFDVAGHYARPDVFQLQVNERPCMPVTRFGATSGPAPPPR
eukprot:tig00020875_g14888.t1